MVGSQGRATAAVAAVAVMLALVGPPAAAAAPLSAGAGVVAPPPAAEARPAWQRRLDRILKRRNVGVSVRLHGSTLYSRHGRKDRVPASNQKLLLTLALLDTVDPAARIRTTASAEQITATTIHGDLWLVGGGDPGVTGGGSFARTLPYRPTKLRRLARMIHDAGITRITGAVRGDVSAFSRDWWAHGWRSHYPQRYAPLASGLAFNGNVARGRHIDDPEARAAESLTRKLRALGVRVGGKPATGVAPPAAQVIAEVTSVPVVRIVRHMNRGSSNFYAEMLGKYLAASRGDTSVTIAGGAATVQQWAADRGVAITAHDASGLSWENRASTQDIARLLDAAAVTSTARTTLARPGQGTLERRLGGVKVRAKTGTLPGHSALSGYVYLQRRDEWAAFSILCDGMSKSSAVELENKVVKLLEARAR